MAEDFKELAPWFGRFEKYVASLQSDSVAAGEVPERIAAERDELRALLAAARERALEGKKK